MPRLVRAFAAQARLDFALSALSEAVQEHGEVLLIAPTQRAADDLLRQAALPQGGLLGVHRTTLAHLASEVAALPLARSARTRLSGLGAQAIAAHTLVRVRAEAELSYFGPVAATAGFVTALGRTLGDLRRAGIGAEALHNLGPAGMDLSRLLKAYEHELRLRGLADAAAILDAAEGGVRTGAHHLLDRPWVLLDAAPTDRATRRLLQAMLTRAPTATAALHSRDARGLEVLEALFGEPSVALDEPAPHDSLQRTRVYVFDEQTPPPEPLDESLQLFSAPGEARECVEIVRHIRRLAAQGTRFDQMAVLLPDAQTYQPLIEDALGRAEVEGFFTQGVRRPDPAGRALVALLACASEGLSASRFSEYLSLGQLPAPASGAEPSDPTWVPPCDEMQFQLRSAPDGPATRPAEGAHPEVPLHWDRLLVDAAVIGGKDRWRRRLDGLEQELRHQLEGLDEGEGPRRARRHQDLDAVSNLRRFALPLIDALAELPQEAPWGVWLEHLRTLATLALAWPKPVLAALAELSAMSEVGPVRLEEVQAVLTDRLSLLRQAPVGARFSKVFVGGLEEAAGRSFEVVFVPGLAEGVLPARLSEDPLLLDETRAALSPELPTRLDGLAQQRLRLHHALGAARSKLLLSYPRVNVAHGRPRVPSFYALDVLRAAGGAVPDLDALRRQAAQAGQAPLAWPSPHDPQRAIDETEYDLASLARHIFGTNPEPAGHGHYLVAAAADEPRARIAVRNLRAQASVWRKAWSRADGLITSPDRAGPRAEAQLAQAALMAHRPSQRVYSATALAAFAACPYRFYLQSILGLRAQRPPAPLEAMDPATRGTLFHRVQFECLRRLAKDELLPLSAEALPQGLQRLDEVAQAVLQQAEEDLAPAIASVWQREGELLLFDLRAWLREVAADRAWVPSHFELSFGLPRRPESQDVHSSEAAVTILDRFLVRGSVDLVQRHASEPRLRVTDHKTGRGPDSVPVHVGGGEHLQPLIYGLAVQALLQAPVESGRLYYCTHRGQYREVNIELNEAAEQSLQQVFETIEASVQDGFLPAAPRSQACTYCEVRVACGPNLEHRVQRKDQGRLEALHTLRGLP